MQAVVLEAYWHIFCNYKCASRTHIEIEAI